MASSSWELLPGIPNDVTLTHIATRLPWAAFYSLSSTSRAWHRAIRSREIYLERTRCHGTETLVAVKHFHNDFADHTSRKNAISLYSMREKRFYPLPPLPRLAGISRYCKFLFANGKLYVSGVDEACSAEQDTAVHVFDLAGQGQWEECIGIPDRECQCNVGGCALVTGDGVFLRSGCEHSFAAFWQERRLIQGADKVEFRAADPSRALALDIIKEKPFAVGGKVYRMTSEDDEDLSIYVYDFNTRSWTSQHSISCDAIETEIADHLKLEGPFRLEPLFILPVNNELLALSSCERRGRTSQYILVQSKGFGTKRFEIEWERAPHSFYFDVESSLAMCPINL